MSMNNKCSVLITTCDNYSDAWHPFFELFKKNWNNCPYDIYVNSETERDDFGIKNIKWLLNGKNLSWSERLKKSLLEINSDYIITMLEDFFIKNEIVQKEIDECIEYLDAHLNVAVIYFYPTDSYGQLIGGKYLEVNRKCKWAINGDCGIWRKDILINLLRDENPWEFETYGTYRWRKTKYKLLTYNKNYPRVIDYTFNTVCGERTAIIQGKWLECVPQYLEEQNIHINYSKRGFANLNSYVSLEKKKNWLLLDIKESLTSLTKLKHYFKCLIDVTNYKLIPIKAILFHR